MTAPWPQSWPSGTSGRTAAHAPPPQPTRSCSDHGGNAHQRARLHRRQCRRQRAHQSTTGPLATPCRCVSAAQHAAPVTHRSSAGTSSPRCALIYSSTAVPSDAKPAEPRTAAAPASPSDAARTVVTRSDDDAIHADAAAWSVSAAIAVIPTTLAICDIRANMR
jgi:hypothetical protein